MSDSRSSFEDYIDNFDRTAHGAGSQKGKDRFSALDINKMFKARGDLSKAEGAQMVLDYADKAGAEGSSMGGGSKRELDQLRGYLNDNSKEETTEEDPELVTSPKVAHAKARLSQWKDDVLSGHTGEELFGKSGGNDAAKSFLERYKIKLGKQDEDGNYFNPSQSE